MSEENGIQKTIPWLYILAKINMLSSNKQAIKWRYIEKVPCSSWSKNADILIRTSTGFSPQLNMWMILKNSFTFQ